MDTIYIRRSLNGKTFVASATPDFAGLEGRKCPFTGDGFESQIKGADADKSEIMGMNFAEALAGVKKDGLYFGKFRINLGATVIME
jgi:hypothetical protein